MNLTQEFQYVALLTLILVILIGSSFTISSTYKLNSSKPFLIEKHAQTGKIICKYSQSTVVKHQVYCLNNCMSTKTPPPIAKAEDEFNTKCNSGSFSQNRNHQPAPISLSTLRKVYMNDAFNPSVNRTVKVFVFDFRLVSDNVFIDFNRLNLTSELNATSLIINLVTKQFVTFRLVNFPKLSPDRFKILLNGECSLNMFEPKSATPAYVPIINSPPYDRTSDRQEWIDYLEKLTGSKIDRYVEYLSMFCQISHVRVDINRMLYAAAETVVDSNQQENLAQRMEEINESANELLSDYCLLKYCNQIEIDKPFFKSSMSRNNNSTNKKNKHKNNVNVVQLKEQQHVRKRNFFGFSKIRIDNDHLFNLENQIFIFEIEQFDPVSDENDDLFVFINECDINKQYILILYVNYNSTLGNATQSDGGQNKQLKKIILDDLNCQIKVYSNSFVYDILGEKYYNSAKIDLDLFTQQYTTSPSNEPKTNINQTNRKSHAKKDYDNHLKENMLDFLIMEFKAPLKSFYYLKIVKNANHVELRFLVETTKPDIASFKFFNKLKNQVFVENESIKKLNSPNSSSNKSFNLAVKFALSENDLYEYFKHHYLNLAKFLDDSSLVKVNSKQDSEEKYFFITNRKCRATILTNELTYELNKFLLLFNSKLVDTLQSANVIDQCFYYEKYTNTVFATFGFSLYEDNFTNSIYFTIKSQPELTVSNVKNYQLSDRKREKSALDYYTNVLEQSAKATYKVNTNILSEKRDLKQRHSPGVNDRDVDVNTRVRIETLDRELAWKLDVCWLDDHKCSNKIDDGLAYLNDVNSNIYIKDYFDEMEDENYDDSYATYYDEPTNNRLKKRYINRKLANVAFNSLKYRINSFNNYHQLIDINNNNNNIDSSNHTLHTGDSYYEYHLNVSLTLFNLTNTDSKKYILCNLKPSCNYDYLFENSTVKIISMCDKNSKIYKYFEQTDNIGKSKTIILAKFSSNGFDELEQYNDYVEFNKENTKFMCSIMETLNNINKNLDNRSGVKSNAKTTVKSDAKSTSTERTFTYIDTVTSRAKSSSTLSGWISSNKMTALLGVALVIFSLIVIVMLKTLLLKNHSLSFKFKCISQLRERTLLNNEQDKDQKQPESMIFEPLKDAENESKNFIKKNKNGLLMTNL